MTATAQPLQEIPATRVEDCLRQKKSLFVCAISFEQRCVTAAQSAGGHGVSDALILTYPTEAHPPDQDRQRRAQHREALLRALEAASIRESDVAAYATSPFASLLESEIATTRPEVVVVDVTCMTKAHTVALAAVSTQAGPSPDFIYAYTTPVNYQLPSAKRSLGWRDVIILPIGDAPRFRREGHARGILLAGHEADRVSVAFAALEPAAGLIVMSEARGRPDFHSVSEATHSHILRRLERLRMPGEGVEGRSLDGWTRTTVSLSKLEVLSGPIHEEVRRASETDAPLLLFPFGPKAVVLAASLQLAAEYRNASWCVYPVPTAYDVDYTFGASQTQWFSTSAAGVR